MYILGIDPGFAIVGWGIVEVHKGNVRPVAYGAITTPAHTPIESRLLMIANDLETIIEKYRPEEMAVEVYHHTTIVGIGQYYIGIFGPTVLYPFGCSFPSGSAKNITTGIAVAEARGVIICTAHKLGVKVSEYTPLQVKQAVVGYGKAEKQQVIAMVTALLKLPKPPKPDDTADALAIALCHSQCAGSAMGKYFNQRG